LAHVTPQAEWLEVTRINHNMGKIHDAEVASFELKYSRPMASPCCAPSGWTFRQVFPQGRPGKDVTDKF